MYKCIYSHIIFHNKEPVLLGDKVDCGVAFGRESRARRVLSDGHRVQQFGEDAARGQGLARRGERRRDEAVCVGCYGHLQKDQQVTQTHTPTEKNTPDTDTHTHTTRRCNFWRRGV